MEQRQNYHLQDDIYRDYGLNINTNNIEIMIIKRDMEENFRLSRVKLKFFESFTFEV